MRTGKTRSLNSFLQLLLLVAGEVVPAHQLDVLLGERRARSRRGTAPPGAAISADVVLQICSSTSRGSRPDAAGTATPGGDPALEAGDPHHEELVEVGGEDRQEPHPLQQRQVLVLGELEHAGVEVQPGQLAVEEPVGRRGRVRRRRTAARRRTARGRPTRSSVGPSSRRPATWVASELLAVVSAVMGTSSHCTGELRVTNWQTGPRAVVMASGRRAYCTWVSSAAWVNPSRS